MFAKRIIPCLDIKDGRVVKGVNFLGLRDAGDPVETAAAYSVSGADEVVFLDINASHEGRGTVAELAGRVAEQLTIPFTVGGGHPHGGGFSYPAAPGSGQDFRQFCGY